MSQTFDAFYASLANSCNYDTIAEYLQQFENFGIKELNDPALNNTKDWIVQKYQDWGYTDIIEDDCSTDGLLYICIHSSRHTYSHLKRPK